MDRLKKTGVPEDDLPLHEIPCTVEQERAHRSALATVLHARLLLLRAVRGPAVRARALMI